MPWILLNNMPYLITKTWVRIGGNDVATFPPRVLDQAHGLKPIIFWLLEIRNYECGASATLAASVQ
jgi:hypothetical protein